MGKNASTVTKTYTLYGRVAGAQTKPNGFYTDSPTVSVSWQAGSQNTEPFTLAEEVIPDCAIDATNMDFGSYTGGGTTSQSTLTLRCNR